MVSEMKEKDLTFMKRLMIGIASGLTIFAITLGVKFVSDYYSFKYMRDDFKQFKIDIKQEIKSCKEDFINKGNFEDYKALEESKRNEISTRIDYVERYCNQRYRFTNKDQANAR